MRGGNVAIIRLQTPNRKIAVEMMMKARKHNSTPTLTRMIMPHLMEPLLMVAQIRTMMALNKKSSAEQMGPMVYMTQIRSKTMVMRNSTLQMTILMTLPMTTLSSTMSPSLRRKTTKMRMLDRSHA
jgi:hypothetical protein